MHLVLPRVRGRGRWFSCICDWSKRVRFLSIRPTSLAALTGVLGLGAGCQHYEARPLDLDMHHDAWHARSADDASVRAFAAALSCPERPVSFDLSDGLSLTEAEIVALVYNPDLRLARLRAGVAAATVEHADVWADPEFSLDFLRVTEAVSDPWVITPGLALTIPISGRLEAERARADAALRMALIDVAEQEWMSRLELRRAWIRWSSAVLRAEEIQRLLTTIEPLVSGMARLAESGELRATEAGLFAIEQAGQMQSLLKARGEAAEWSQRIRMLMGLSPDAPVDCNPTLLVDPGGQIDPGDRAAGHLGLAGLREAYEVAEMTLLREIRRQYPDLVIGPLYEQDQGQSRIGLFGGLPLPIFNANRQAIAEAKAERDVARAAFEIAYEHVVGSLAATRARREAITERRQLLERDSVPLVDRQLASAKRLFELGEGGGLVLLESIVQAGQARLALIDARASESLSMTDVAGLGPPPSNTAAYAQPEVPEEAAPVPAAYQLEVVP